MPCLPQSLLAKELAQSLPAGFTFKVYHVSTPPIKCHPLFAAAPESKPEPTYCESHQLNVAIACPSVAGPDGVHSEILIFAMEVLVYSTASLTTIFVSKADSTGYLHHLGLPREAPSPLRSIASTFLAFLSAHRRRINIKLLLSLFARAQDQYLFPGSIDNKGKHLLDDRGLIRWWCRVLDPIVRSTVSRTAEDSLNGITSTKDTLKAYLLVPGLDRQETLNLLSTPMSSDRSQRDLWIIGHPLYLLSGSPSAPPRCLIPRFPDDPKARFVEELDEELPEVVQGEICSPSKRTDLGRWKSAKTLEQFWEAMMFRQECSSGRLVGFVWVLVESRKSPLESAELATATSGVSTPAAGGRDRTADMAMLRDGSPTPTRGLKRARETKSDVVNRLATPQTAALRRNGDKGNSERTVGERRRTTSRRPERKQKLSGPIIPRQPRIKKASPSSADDPPVEDTSPYYTWPQDSRGQVVIPTRDYMRINDFLLRLDFSDRETAQASTTRWVQEVRMTAGLSEDDDWGESVTGTKVWERHVQMALGAVNSLGAGSIRKKPKDDASAGETTAAGGDEPPSMHILSAGLIRKKPKGEARS
ncbi:MAG: hypothetical protein M1815_005204 [Lichina confinis]|nr:MAG: hypothetical protein M1815_005204 [Lichina confinis]